MGPHWILRSLQGPSVEQWSNSYCSSLPPQLFSDVAYKARDREDLIAGIDEFLDEVIVLPPGEWDPKIRIEPPKKVTSADKRWACSHGLGTFSLVVLSYPNLEVTFWSCRKSVFSLNELGQMNGTAGGAGGLAEDEEMPEQHELGEELAFTGRWVSGDCR